MTGTRTPTHATYLYCLVASRRAPSLVRVPRGLPGARKPRVLGAGGGLWLVAADAPLDRYGEEPIARGLQDLAWVSSCAVAHESVVEHFARADALLPMKLFTLFATDERACAHIARQRRRLDATIGRVRGCAEWSLRLRFDPARALADAEAAAAAPVSGAAFLRRKKRQVEVEREVALDLDARAGQVHRALGRRARKSVRRPPPDEIALGPPLLLDAAYLVPHREARAFGQAAAKLARTLAREGGELTLSGPWPPYHFVGGRLA